MTGQEGSTGTRRSFPPPTGEVVELMLLLTSNQFSALEVVAGRLNLTVGRLLRRTISDFLLQPLPRGGEGRPGWEAPEREGT